ncbi:Lsd1/2 complex PHD finger containing protein Phf2 [Porites harrisoni]
MADPLYCICRQAYDPSQFMIQCDSCEEWYHGSCVGIEEYQAPDIERYHCPQCALLHGPLTRKYPYLFCFLQLRIFLKLEALKLLFIDCLGVQIDAKTKPERR